MIDRNKAARTAISLGAMILIAAALLHLSDYTKDMRAASASNLSASMQGEMRSLFLLVGWNWLVLAIITLMSAVAVKEVRKSIVLFCGLAVLATVAVVLRSMGWFWGCGVLLSSALFILGGGLLCDNTVDLRSGLIAGVPPA
jgi:hypothetical protein